LKSGRNAKFSNRRCTTKLMAGFFIRINIKSPGKVLPLTGPREFRKLRLQKK
jgi:hypothetical protein